MKKKYSIYSLVKNSLSDNQNWKKMWRNPEPRKFYDVIIVGVRNQISSFFMLVIFAWGLHNFHQLRYLLVDFHDNSGKVTGANGKLEIFLVVPSGRSRHVPHLK